MSQNEFCCILPLSVSGWASHILVIDDYSHDKTVEIARSYGARVITHQMDQFGAQRAFALEQVPTIWTLVLDSDEELTFDSKSEILKAVESGECDGYKMKFRNHLFGKKLLHGELHKKLVLFKTKNASISSKAVHEHYEVIGKIGTLLSEVNHFSYRSISQIARKFFSYSILQAKEYKIEKKKYGLRELILHPVHMFYARFIQDGGYKDGIARIFLDYQFAKMEFLSYFLIPYVKAKRRIAVDCGPYAVGGVVQSGIERLIQGMYVGKSKESDYYWFSFNAQSPNTLPKRLFSSVWLALATVINRCDVFLGTAGTIPTILKYFPIQKILFLHDFGFFTSPDKYNSSAKRLQAQTENSIRIADTIVVFHHEIYKEFIHRYPEYIYKVEIIPAGANHLEKIKEKPVFIQPRKPLFLFVGVVKPVKRIDLILSVIGDIYCVIAGPQEAQYIKTLHVGKTQYVQFIKHFNDGQLKWLYNRAELMVYTSEHEGFCYPVLEELSLGLSVVAFDLPLFREYKKYFSHLILVSNAEEMRKELQIPRKKITSSFSHNPFTWEQFNSSLSLVWNVPPISIVNKSKFAFIVVLYKTPQADIIRLENEIENMKLSSFVTYWIDNSSNGAGYAAGVNEGIRRGLIDGCDIFIALNPDISLQSITANNIYDVSSEFAVWGFAMRQNNTVYFGGEIDKWRLSGGLEQTHPPQRYASVNFISGSVMGFSKQVVQTIGMWDESYFMYYEDVDYCERARKAGLQVGIDSSVVYDHFEVSQANKKKDVWIAKSRWNFFWKYSNVKQKMREIARLPKTISGL